MAPKIEARDLSVWYGRHLILKRVSLTVEPGQVLAIIGPSGCGKSTFLRTLNRLLEEVPDVKVQGEVLIGPENIYDPKVDVTQLRRRVGMVFQQPNPFPLSIFDNVAYGLRLKAARGGVNIRRIVEKSLTQAALWDEVRGKLRRPASALSGGQQQRLCIARALAVGPEVLLMDEPTASLDPVSATKIEELLAQLRGQYTILMVTHNLRQAARVSDHTAFFSNGELVEEGPTQQIFTAPKDARTEQYLTGRFES